MTVQEAIQLMKSRVETATELMGKGIDGKAYEDMEMAIECMEKQIPKKVQKLESKILIADGWQYQCPKCKCAVGINQHAEEQTQEDEYCPTCGQALKWGEEDEQG